MKKLTFFITFAATLAFVAAAFPTTWGATNVTCPVCGTGNDFQSVMSWGTYIYDWPSKYQLIFWPYTDGNVVYSCSNCKLSCFMADFEEIPAGKRDVLKDVLSGVDLDGTRGSYAGIPMSARLAAAEKVYSVLDKDDDFWCHFYRVVGYHCEAEGKVEEAAAARVKALVLAEAMFKEEARVGERKELLLMAGAMRHLTGDDGGALRDFEEALALKYENAELTPERNKGYDGYLTGLLTDYVEKIKSGDED